MTKLSPKHSESAPPSVRERHIDRTTQMRTNPPYLFRVYYRKGGGHQLVFGRDSKAGRQARGSFIVRKKKLKGGFRCAWMGGCWAGEAGGSLT